VLVLVCMGVRGEVDKASWTMLRGRLGEGRNTVNSGGASSERRLRMCRIKGDGLGVAGFGSLGRYWGVERGLGGIWGSVVSVYVGRAEEKKWVWLSPSW